MVLVVVVVWWCCVGGGVVVCLCCDGGGGVVFSAVLGTVANFISIGLDRGHWTGSATALTVAVNQSRRK